MVVPESGGPTSDTAVGDRGQGGVRGIWHRCRPGVITVLDGLRPRVSTGAPVPMYSLVFHCRCSAAAERGKPIETRDVGLFPPPPPDALCRSARGRCTARGEPRTRDRREQFRPDLDQPAHPTLARRADASPTSCAGSSSTIDTRRCCAPLVADTCGRPDRSAPVGSASCLGGAGDDRDGLELVVVRGESPRGFPEGAERDGLGARSRARRDHQRARARRRPRTRGSTSTTPAAAANPAPDGGPLEHGLTVNQVVRAVRSCRRRPRCSSRASTRSGVDPPHPRSAIRTRRTLPIPESERLRCRSARPTRVLAGLLRPRRLTTTAARATRR